VRLSSLTLLLPRQAGKPDLLPERVREADGRADAVDAAVAPREPGVGDVLVAGLGVERPAPAQIDLEADLGAEQELLEPADEALVLVLEGVVELQAGADLDVGRQAR